MTIGYILDDTLDKGDGVQQAMIVIAEKMRSNGHDVHYIVPFTERTDLQNVHSIARIIALKFNGNSIRTPIWTSKKRVKTLYNKINFDVLHVQMPYSPIMAGKVIKLAPKNTKIIGTFHILPYNWIAKFGTRVLGFIVKSSKKKINHSFAVSQPALSFMKSEFGLDGTVLANPVDYKFFHSFTKETNRDKIKTKIVFLGRFEERKGVKQLVRAYEMLNDRKDVKLIMCGKGPMLQELQQYSELHKLNIVFTGFVTDEQKAAYLANADIAVFPSTGGESFGIVLAEAMSAGSGVTIGGNNPGYRSVLEPWPNTLFDPNNVREFSQKIHEFVIDHKNRRSIGRSQHEAVKAYDVSNIVHTLETYYKK